MSQKIFIEQFSKEEDEQFRRLRRQYNRVYMRRYRDKTRVKPYSPQYERRVKNNAEKEN